MYVGGQKDLDSSEMTHTELMESTNASPSLLTEFKGLLHQEDVLFHPSVAAFGWQEGWKPTSSGRWDFSFSCPPVLSFSLEREEMPSRN